MPTILLLIVCTLVYTETSSECPKVTLRKGSTTAPVVSNGTNYTLYQEFVTEGDVHDLSIVWSREPFPLDPSNATHREENTYVDRTTVNASLILWDIQLVPTDGKYTVTASNDCGASNKTVFYLHVDVTCTEYETPQPIILRNTSTLAEPDLENTLQLSVIFHGENSDDFVTLWTAGDSEICLEDSDYHFPGFRCERTLLGPCWFTADLWILNPTYDSSGEYSVHATDSGGNEGNSSTVDLIIVRQPKVQSCSAGSLKTNSQKRADFQCNLSNYSDYVRVLVVEDNKIEYNESSDALSFGCEAHISDRSLATCTVSISSSAHYSKRQYKLCAGYNDSVAHTTQLQCSDNLNVTFTGRSDNKDLMYGLITGGSVGCLCVMLALSVLVYVAYRKLSSGSNSVAFSNDPRRPLLPSAQAVGTDAERDYQPSGDTSVQSPGAVPLWRTVSDGPLERKDLINIAKVLPRWSTLARYLGLPEAAIVAISEDHRGNYEEQKYQMLLQWHQQQATPPTKRDLMRIIEERMGSKVAQDTANIVGTTMPIST